jgi:hypothetical protein
MSRNHNGLLDNLINELRWGNQYLTDDKGEFILDEKGERIVDEDYAERKAEEVNAHIEKLQSVGAIYSKTDRIITGDPVEVRVEDNPDMDTTAYNDGKHIVFNAHLLEEVTDESIVSLHGFNYHEVGHILYTPRGGSDFGTTIRQEGLQVAFNILEDSRIERLLIAKYPATAPFLEASSLEYILKGDSKEWHLFFPLMTGRKYLDIELRQELADRFIKESGVATAQTVSLIVHEYRTLVFPRDYARALDLIRLFADLVGRNQEQGNPIIPNGGGEGGHADREVMKSGRMSGTKEQEAMQNKADQQESGSGVGTEKLDEPTDHTNRNDSVGLTDTDSDSDKKTKEKVQKALDSLINNEEVKRDTKEVRKAISNNANSSNAIKQGAYTMQEVKPQVQATARAFAVAMERIRIDNDPAWELEVESGRLNVGRAMHADINDINTLFDRWSEGNSNNDVEAIILVDTSGSMSWQIQRTMESAWIIKKGIERINGRVAVYKFNHDSRLIYGYEDKAKPTEYRYVNSSGGTNPYKALLEAQRLLNASRRGVRILFVVTDGYWDMTTENNKIIKQLGDSGVMTAVAYLGRLDYWKEQDPDYYKRMLVELRHEAKIMRAVDNPSDLVLIAKDLVKATMGSRH